LQILGGSDLASGTFYWASMNDMRVIICDMNILAKKRRWRVPLHGHLQLLQEHLHRFIQSKGSCAYFQRFPTDMMQEVLDLIKRIGAFNDRYKSWIKANEKNAQRYLKEV
jgi:hypothetical protein